MSSISTRVYKTGVCSVCGTEGYIAAREMCRTCYQRWRKNGHAGYVRNFADRVCTVEDCGQRAHGQGLCSKHLLRLRRTGTVAEGRRYILTSKKPEDLITQHDLYSVWCEFKRSRSARKVVQEWADSFELFRDDVGGTRPSKRHRIYPIDKSRLMGPGNFEWRTAIIDKDPNETDVQYRARVRQATREIHGTSYNNGELLRKYGITLRQFQAMWDAQEGKCAICGEVKPLDVDHNHTTKAVRQLLCTPCNTGIGHLGENVANMVAAIEYLQRHGPVDEETGKQMIAEAKAYLARHPVASLDKDAILPQS